MILAEEKIRQHDRELQTDPSSGTYNLETQEVRGGEELEKIAVSRKPLRELSCNSNVRTNLVPEDDMKIVKRMICVKLGDDTHNPGEMNGQIMALKEHVKARYRLSDLIRAQKNDKMTSNLSKWIHSGVKEKGELEEDSYKILSQFYKEKRDLLYHTAEGVVACKRRDEEKILHKHNLIILPQLYQTEVLFRSHDQMGHQGIDKVQQRILHRFDWPGMRKACERWVNACLACLQVKDPRKMKFPLKSVESSEFNEVVQIDHQKICMTESGYNQILVIIDHFTKLAEAVPCQTASAEETCDHLITHWISRYGCPMTFQSDNGKAFVGDLTKELMKRSHIAQAHSTTYHPQTNGLVERQNRTLVNMLRVYCSRYMTDWDKYLPQVVGAYNSTQHSTTGISPFMMLTGRERAMPITFFYPEYEGKRTSPQAYVKEAIKRQQELNELCRRNTAQAQMRQRKKYDEKILRAKPYEVGQYVWVFQNVIPPKGTKKLLKKWRGPFMITEVHQQGRFYRLSTGRAAHYENLKPHVPSPEDWCLPRDMEGLEYLVVEPACEVNEKGTREKNDGNENLSLDDNEKIEVESDAGSFVEEDWNDPEQNEVPKWMEPDRPTPPETRTGNRKRTGMRYNRYGDDFLIDKIQPDKLGDELLSAGELEAGEEWQVIDDGGHYPQDDYSTPELETDLEQSEIERRENTNLRILEWMRDVKDESHEGQSIQQVDISAANYMKTEDPLFGWTATDRPLDIPKDNSDPTTSTGTSINIFVRGVGVGLTHTENLMIKKLKEVRETSGLELEEEEPEPTIGRNFKTKFEIPNEYSENIMITDSDFILSNRTSAICITADMSFKSRLEADFKREYQNVEFLFRQRPGLGGIAALPPSVAQVPGKYLCFLVTRVNDRNTIDPEHVILALTRLRDFMIERGIVEVSMPVYDPNRGKLSSRELYAILHVVFAETEIMVHLLEYKLNESTVPCLPLSMILIAFNISHTQDIKGHSGSEKTYSNFIQNFYFPNAPIWIKVLCNDCIVCQLNKPYPNQKQIAQKQDFKGQSLYFNHRISFDTKGPISPSSEGNSYIMVIVDAFTHYVALNPVPHCNAYYAYTTLYEHWIAKFGLPEILVTDNGTEFINNEIITLCHLYNIKHKPRTSHAPWTNGLVEGMNRSLQEYLRCIINGNDTKYTEWSADVKLFPLAYNSQITTTLEMSPYEMVFNQKPRKPIMFTANSHKNAQSHCQPNKDSICYNLPLHTHDEDHFHHPQILKLASGTRTEWILNRDKKHNEIYQKVTKKLLQRQNINEQINSRFTPASDLKIGTFVLIPNFNTQKGISKKLQPLRKGPYQIIAKPTDVTYKITDSDKKEIVQHRNNILPYYPKEYALRELTQLYFFTGLKIIQNNPHTENETKEQHDNHLKNQNKKSTTTKNNTKKLDQNIPQKERKNRKLTEKIIPQEQIDKSEHRESSRLRNQPRKNYKTFIPQSKILKKVEFQKRL